MELDAVVRRQMEELGLKLKEPEQNGTVINTFTFCEWLQQEMNDADLTASQVARMSGLTPSSVRGLKKGRQFPTLYTMQELARIFGKQIVIQ